MSKKKDTGDYTQLTLFDILGLAGNIEGNYSSKEIEEAIYKLREAKHYAEKREEKERIRKEKEEAERKAREEKERKDAHVREVTCMDLPLDWDNVFNSDQRTAGVHIDSISDGLILSLANLGKVDIEFISSVTGADYKTVISTLKGSIYQNPLTWNECFYQGWETAEEYLSGNLMRKWKAACEANDEYNGYFSENIKAIEKVLPPTVATISIRDPSNQRGLLPLFAERLFKELKKPQTDWRMILNDFVQEEIVDYSFTPPDRRFDESPFFLPDFNDKDDLVEDILFMIDTSGSMSDDMITAAYSEVKGAIDQFDGKLKGWLGFFDAAIIEPKPFTNEAEFRIIKPAGGGGTDFQIIFEYVQKHMRDKFPASIIILTDGFAPFPKEKLAGGIPVLWLLNNDQVDPPWGKVARITV